MRSITKLFCGALLALFAVSMVAVPLTAGPPNDVSHLTAVVAAPVISLAAAPAATVAIATAPDIAGPSTPTGLLVLAVLTPIVGWIASKVYDGLKTIVPAYDKLPATVHQAAAPLLQFAFGWLAMKLSLPVLTDLHGLTAEFIGAALVTLSAAGIKRWEKSKEPGDATIALERSRESQPV